MSIAITEDHRALADTARDFFRKQDTRAAARALLESSDESLPLFWTSVVALGWPGLAASEEYGGSGFGLEELVVLVEEHGRALTPGPFVPTALATAFLSAVGGDTAKLIVPALIDGSRTAAVAFGGAVEVRDGRYYGSAGAALAGGLADLILVSVGDDVLVLDRDAAGVEVAVPANLDRSRRSARVTLEGASGTVLSGAAVLLRDLSRVLLSAEAVGVARQCTEMAAEYAKIREQFGRPIAMFQAVKHHCANMLVATELATAAVWDAARAARSGGDELSLAAAIAASLAGPAADLCANLNIQVHGGIGFTWEHDAHLYLRRAVALRALLDPNRAAVDATDLTRAGVRRGNAVDLPPEAEQVRTEVRAFVEQIAGLDAAAQKSALIESGYVMPHWPRPWGRDAGAVEQLVIEQEFTAAGIKRPSYGITGWVILTLIQNATPEQVARWVPSALTEEVVWCQLFSEPGAGSDAAGAKTRATRVEGGWLINGQKVWTSGAHIAGRGFATVRTDPDVPKHDGITTVVIDMKADGVEVRPLRMVTGHSEFNEVFFNDVFVPDDDVVGPINGGWKVARATLGNESVSIGGGQGGAAMSMPPEFLIPLYDAHPERLAGGATRLGNYIATHRAMGLLNLRSAHRAVAGGGPGPEGNVTKLVLSELAQDAAGILTDTAGADTALADGDGAMSSGLVLGQRALSIAGGTSEIKRNQIGERILGLPRDPLIK